MGEMTATDFERISPVACRKRIEAATAVVHLKLSCVSACFPFDFGEGDF